MSPTTEQLLVIARGYWRADKAYHSRTDSSPEHQRLEALWEEELKHLDRWWAFLEELERELPEFRIGDATATPDASFRCAAYAPPDPAPEASGLIVVGCVSILAPVYTLYGVHYTRMGNKRHAPRVHLPPLPAEMRRPAEVIARRIEATFGVTALPPDIAHTPIPLHVEPREPPDTTLFHALFTSEPERLP
jgi:hypothetical protein